MSIHKSLIGAGTLKGHRNVLTRPERIAILLAEERRKEADSVFGLPKVRNIMMKAKKTKKEDEATEEGAVEGATTAEGSAAVASGDTEKKKK